jgi:ribosome-associated heat shock protein Hsp15
MSEDWLRADKWLWYARFFKTRSLATKACTAGGLRVEGAPVSKANSKVKVGDVLTFPQGRHIRVVKVLGLGSRRGPAVEAQALYEDLKPPAKENKLPTDAQAARAPGAGRPTKKERRAFERLVEQGR